MSQETKIKRSRCKAVTFDRVFSTNKARHTNTPKESVNEYRVRRCF